MLQLKLCITLSHVLETTLLPLCTFFLSSVSQEKIKYEVIHFHSIHQLKCDSINYILAVVLRCVSNSADEVCSGTGATWIFTCAVLNCSGHISRKMVFVFVLPGTEPIWGHEWDATQKKKLDIFCKYSGKNSILNCDQYYFTCQVGVCISIQMSTNI